LTAPAAPDAFEAGWQALVTEKGQYPSPVGLPSTGWFPAPVPGTVAEALAALGQAPVRLEDHDVWYRCVLNARGPRQFSFEGLTPRAQVWLGDQLTLESQSMFVRRQVETVCTGSQILTLRFSGPNSGAPPRARWRVRMIPDQSRRAVRATLLGQMPGWTPSIDYIGPWRAITCHEPQPVALTARRVTATYLQPGGRVSVAVRLAGVEDTPTLHCDGHTTGLSALGDGWFAGQLDLAAVEAWWPHTHGGQPLYDLALTAGATVFDLGRVGFRDIRVDASEDGKGFGLLINGAPVFCRGANWVSADANGLQGDEETYAPILNLAREAGMNMLRMSGVGAYETQDFYALCDALGILVWQDFMFANFDYPVADPDFANLVEQEAKDLFNRLGASPCLAVLCGGSEILQQATMFGLPPERAASPLYDALLPALSAQHRPDVPFVRNSPSGGPLPFVINEGVGHYYGVGAYRRSIEDARRANARFITECLGFANLPQPTMTLPALDGPDWKAVVPRDAGADWDFEDVRDFYLNLLLGADPQSLRRDNPALYLDLSRAVTGEVMEQVFAEWRRPGSSCKGGLVWNLQDLAPGAGFGVLDSTGEPKPAWYALKRAFRPVQIALTDEGGNGLGIHLINETAEPLDLELDLRCLRGGAVNVVKARRLVTLPARGGVTLSAFEVLGAFMDIAYAYRFGPPGHDVTVAGLRDPATGEMLAQAFHYPAGVELDASPPVLTTHLVDEADGWTLLLETDRLIRHLHIEDAGFRPSDDWFTLMPGFERRISLMPRSTAGGRPCGRILAPSDAELGRYG
jgi:beta-mannosidase